MASAVTYLVPVMAVTVGLLFLHEPFHLRLRGGRRSSSSAASSCSTARGSDPGNGPRRFPTDRPDGVDAAAWGVQHGYHDAMGRWRDSPAGDDRRRPAHDGRVGRPAAAARTGEPVLFLRPGESKAVSGPVDAHAPRTGPRSGSTSDLPADLPLGYHVLTRLDDGARDHGRRQPRPVPAARRRPHVGVGGAALRRALARPAGAWATWPTSASWPRGRPTSWAPAWSWSTRSTPPHPGSPSRPAPTSRAAAGSATRSTCGWRTCPGPAPPSATASTSWPPPAGRSTASGCIDRDAVWRLKLDALGQVWDAFPGDPAFDRWRDGGGRRPRRLRHLLRPGRGARRRLAGVAGRSSATPTGPRWRPTARPTPTGSGSTSGCSGWSTSSWSRRRRPASAVHARPGGGRRPGRRRRLAVAGRLRPRHGRRRPARRVQHPGPGLGPAPLRPVAAAGRRLRAVRGDHPGRPPPRRRAAHRPRDGPVPPVLDRPGASRPATGAYVRYPASELLDIVALEAHRAGAYVVGEDLGTVEDHVRAEMAARDVLSYRLLWFEDRPPPAVPGAGPGRRHHPRPAHRGRAVDGLRPRGPAPAGHGARTWSPPTRCAGGCGDMIGVAADAPPDEVVAHMYTALGTAPCLLLTAALDDAVTVPERPNMPGTVDEWPNWSIALPLPLEELMADPGPERWPGPSTAGRPPATAATTVVSGGPVIEGLRLWLAGTNAWIVAPDGPGGECVLIDAPPEPRVILHRLRENGLRLVALLTTHGHVDHVGGIGEVVAHAHDGAAEPGPGHPRPPPRRRPPHAPRPGRHRRHPGPDARHGEPAHPAAGDRLRARRRAEGVGGGHDLHRPPHARPHPGLGVLPAGDGGPAAPPVQRRPPLRRVDRPHRPGRRLLRAAHGVDGGEDPAPARRRGGLPRPRGHDHRRPRAPHQPLPPPGVRRPGDPDPV